MVAFNSFHWIDPAVRYAKPAELLREGGALAVVGMRFVVHDHADAGWMALQEDYEAVSGSPEPRTYMDDLKDRSDEFEASGYFRKAALRRYQWDITPTMAAALYVAERTKSLRSGTPRTEAGRP